MKLGKLFFIPGLLGLMSIPLSLQAQAPPAPVPTLSSAKTSVPTDPDVLKAADQLRLAKIIYQNGVGTPADVSQATIGLAEAQMRSALRVDNAAVVQQSLAAIVAQRQILLKMAEVEYRAGAIETDALTQTQLALAQAKARVDLYSIVSLRKQILSQAQIRYNSGADVQKELDSAKDAYSKSQQLFVAGGDGP